MNIIIWLKYKNSPESKIDVQELPFGQRSKSNHNEIPEILFDFLSPYQSRDDV